MRILIVGMPGAGNLGDDLISILLVQHILQSWPQAEIGVLCAGYSIPLPYPDRTRLCWLPAPRRRSWNEYISRAEAIHNFENTADLILIGGGGLFQDSHYRFTVHKWLRNALRTSHKRIPAAAVGVGFGPFNYPFSLWYLKHALARLSVIQARDKGSAAIVSSLGYPARIAPDIVAGSSLTQTPFARQPGKTHERAIGCSIRPWPGLDFGGVVHLISTVSIENHCSVRLFVFEHAEPHNTTEFDYNIQIANALKQKNIFADVFCYCRHPMDEFAHAFITVKMAIASRYHANILWQKLGIPVMPISYAPKVARLYEERGGRSISVGSLDHSPGSDMFQKINLLEPYSLPSDSELLAIADFKPSSLHILSRATGAVETAYGISRSVLLRLNRLRKFL